MRLWSIHPQYLDVKGLVAVWREGLLALCVLQGRTRGYRHHPQLSRFKARRSSVSAIAQYLHGIVDEAEIRGYHFDRTKLPVRKKMRSMPVHKGQMQYEFQHLLNKLAVRDVARYERLRTAIRIRPHPSFHVVPGDVESWEILST